MNDELYYIAPPDDRFEDLKQCAIRLWRIVDTDNDKYGYATEKINRIKDLENFSDNFMVIVAMFDENNQRKLAEMVTHETKLAVRERLLAGGASPLFLTF